MEQKIPQKKIGRNFTLNIPFDYIKTFQYFEFLISRDPNFPEPKNNRKESKVSLVIRKLIRNYVEGNWNKILSNKNEFIQWRNLNYYSDGKKIPFSKKKKSKTKHEKRIKKYSEEELDDYEEETFEDPDVTETLKKEEEE